MEINASDYVVHILNHNIHVWDVLKDIAGSGTQEDAFYICDIGDIVRKHKIWQLHLPRVEPYYAVKCNDNLVVLEVLAALGTGFDCASKSEISRVLSLGVKPSRIIFANPTKPAAHIRYAAKMDIRTITFDNECELHKTKQFYSDAKLVIRIRCDAEIVHCNLGRKFGCDPVTEAPYLLSTARSLGLDVIGVSFHVGSGCGEPLAFRRAIAFSKGIFDCANSLGFDFNLLDIGGGYPGKHNDSIELFAQVINEALDEYFPDPKIRVIAEPGSFYVISAYTLACNIHSIRIIKSEETNLSSQHYMYYIDDGVFGSFSPVLSYQEKFPALPLKLKERKNSKLHSSSIWGPTLDGRDQVVEECTLPELQVGDWVVFENMGAYTLSTASSFNGFPIPKVHFIFDKSVSTILKDILPLGEEYMAFGHTAMGIKANLKHNGDDTCTVSKLPITILISS